MNHPTRSKRESTFAARLKWYTLLLQTGAYVETIPAKIETHKATAYWLVWSQDGELHRETVARSELRWLIGTLNLKRVDQADGTTRFVIRPGQP